MEFNQAVAKHRNGTAGVSLDDVVRAYFEARGLVWPNVGEAFLFLASELGEAARLMMADEEDVHYAVYAKIAEVGEYAEAEVRGTAKRWVRNHPNGEREEEALARELGDVVMMALVTGIVNRTPVVEALLDKMLEKVG